MHWLDMLERLRKEQQGYDHYERPALQIPLPPLRYEEPEKVYNPPENDPQRGVIIIDMYDINED